MSRFEVLTYRRWHWLVVVPVALGIGAVGGLALGGLLDAAWFGRFMLGPGGGALLTVLATATVGVLAYQQGNRRLDYEREKDRLDREERSRLRRYEEELDLLLNLDDGLNKIRMQTVVLSQVKQRHPAQRVRAAFASEPFNSGFKRYIALNSMNDPLADALVELQHHIYVPNQNAEEFTRELGGLTLGAWTAVHDKIDILRGNEEGPTDEV